MPRGAIVTSDYNLLHDMRINDYVTTRSNRDPRRAEHQRMTEDNPGQIMWVVVRQRTPIGAVLIVTATPVNRETFFIVAQSSCRRGSIANNIQKYLAMYLHRRMRCVLSPPSWSF